MNRRTFLRNSTMALPAVGISPYFQSVSSQESGRVSITDVKCILTNLGARVSPLVKIETDAGITGIGECHHDSQGWGAKDVVLNVCRPILLGEDPFDIERNVFRMKTNTSFYGGNNGITVHAITGLEMALWDIVGKITGQPVYRLLGGGGHRSEVRAYLSSRPQNMLDPDSCAEYAEMVHGGGWTAVKVDMLRDQHWLRSLENRRLSNAEVDRNARGYTNLREALGDDVEIVVHAHWELDFDSALRLARAVEHVRPWWFEDPLPIAYNEQWVRLTEQSPIPILTGENLYTRDGFRPFIVNAGVNAIEIDVAMAGGLLEAKKITDLAETYYIPAASHNVGGPIATLATAHWGASVRELLGCEIFPQTSGFSMNGDMDILGYDGDIISNGYFQLGNRPGLGIELNEDLLKTYLVNGEEWWD